LINNEINNDEYAFPQPIKPMCLTSFMVVY